MKFTAARMIYERKLSDIPTPLKTVAPKVVGAGELLKRLERHAIAKECAVQSPMLRLEAVDPPRLEHLLRLELVEDLIDLHLHEAVRLGLVRGDPVRPRDRLRALVPPAVRREPAVQPNERV